MDNNLTPSKTVTKCLNCETEFDVKYCPECGQSAKTGRLKIKVLVKGVLEGFFDLQKPLYRTIIGMTINPGRVVSEYVAGKRKKYANPIKYYFAITALFLLTTQFRGTILNKAREPFEANPDTPEVALAFLNKYFDALVLMTTYEQIFVTLLMPWFAVIFFVFFRKFKYRMAEHMAFGFYVFGHLNLIGLLVLATNLHSFFINAVVTFLNIFQAVYITWCAISFNKSKIFGGILRSLGAWIIFSFSIPLIAVLYVLIKMQMI
jgi:Protein of unknown function (DUF3667)